MYSIKYIILIISIFWY